MSRNGREATISASIANRLPRWSSPNQGNEPKQCLQDCQVLGVTLTRSVAHRKLLNGQPCIGMYSIIRAVSVYPKNPPIPWNEQRMYPIDLMYEQRMYPIGQPSSQSWHSLCDCDVFIILSYDELTLVIFACIFCLVIILHCGCWYPKLLVLFVLIMHSLLFFSFCLHQHDAKLLITLHYFSFLFCTAPLKHSLTHSMTFIRWPDKMSLVKMSRPKWPGLNVPGQNVPGQNDPGQNVPVEMSLFNCSVVG